MSRCAKPLAGRHKLETDFDHIDYFLGNWDALKLCLAVVGSGIVWSFTDIGILTLRDQACLTWVFLAYGIIRHFRDEWIPFFAAAKKWDQVIANGIIWVLQLSAAATQTAFVNDYFHCEVECDSLNLGSISRNTAYAVFAWLLWCVKIPSGYSI
jgi:hypothetical protein